MTRRRHDVSDPSASCDAPQPSAVYGRLRGHSIPVAHCLVSNTSPDQLTSLQGSPRTTRLPQDPAAWTSQAPSPGPCITNVIATFSQWESSFL